MKEIFKKFREFASFVEKHQSKESGHFFIGIEENILTRELRKCMTFKKLKNVLSLYLITECIGFSFVAVNSPPSHSSQTSPSLLSSSLPEGRVLAS